jgi:hypothetical protein
MNILYFAFGAIVVLGLGAVFLALARSTRESQYAQDDGQLSEEYFAWLRQYAKEHIPKGKLLSRKSLF